MVVKEVEVEQLCQCCNCEWIGNHSQSVDKTPVIENMWLLVCPKCRGTEFFLYSDK
jgi:Zn finger protein HypA/HybF involved in hydrogenase expression